MDNDGDLNVNKWTDYLKIFYVKYVLFHFPDTLPSIFPLIIFL